MKSRDINVTIATTEKFAGWGKVVGRSVCVICERSLVDNVVFYFTLTLRHVNLWL